MTQDTSGQNNNVYKGIFAQTSRGIRIWLLVALFCIALLIVQFATLIIVGDTPTRASLLLSATIQDIVAFIAPAAIMARLVSRTPMHTLALRVPLTFRSIAGVVLIYIISLPALNMLVEWNNSITFPGVIEQTLRNMEQSASEVTAVLLGSESWTEMLLSVLIVGVLAGFSEELFFRGALQQTLYRRRPIIAVWMTALVFSILHFQFYGFVPRLLLGAYFGLLLMWTHSLWPGILAHILNNSVTVVASWGVIRGYWTEQQCNIGVGGTTADITIAIVSALLTLAILSLPTLRLYFFRANN